MRPLCYFDDFFGLKRRRYDTGDFFTKNARLSLTSFLHLFSKKKSMRTGGEGGEGGKMDIVKKIILSELLIYKPFYLRDYLLQYGKCQGKRSCTSSLVVHSTPRNELIGFR